MKDEKHRVSCCRQLDTEEWKSLDADVKAHALVEAARKSGEESGEESGE